MKRLSFLIACIITMFLIVVACSSEDGNSNSSGLKIDSFSPDFGPIGTRVWITGKNFGSAPTVKIGNAIMTIDGTPTDTEIFAFIPDGATTGRISVTANGDTYTGGEFEVTEDEESSFPTVDSLSDTELKPGDILTISGSGFDPDATYVVTFSNNVQGAIIEINENYLKVEVPEGATSGEITLSVNAETNITGPIGSMTISEVVIPELYIFDYTLDKLAKINIETGQLTYIGEDIPYGYNTRSAVVWGNEYIGFQRDNNLHEPDPTLVKINLETGDFLSVAIQNEVSDGFEEMIVDGQGNLYLFHDKDVKRVAQINPNDGSLTYIGESTIPDYGNNTRGAVYHQGNNEYIGLEMHNQNHETAPRIVRINLESGEVTIVPIPESELSEEIDFDDFTIDENDNVYTYYTSEERLVQIDINTGELTRIGENIGYGKNTRGMVYHPITNEIIGFQMYDENQETNPTIVRINIDTGEAITVPITPLPEPTNFTDLAIKK